jgi:hypothetical protein
MMLVSRHSRKQMKKTVVVISMVGSRCGKHASSPGTANTFWGILMFTQDTRR